MSRSDEQIASGILGCFLILGLLLGFAAFAGVVVWIWKHALS